jgi:hypothetical protein
MMSCSPFLKFINDVIDDKWRRRNQDSSSKIVG